MKNLTIKIAPSLLSCDFADLAQETRKIEAANADAIHLDIMDGMFVPNISFGPKIVAAVNRITELFLDVHLMIYNPYNFIEKFIEAGADMITFHFEATEDIEDTLYYVKKCGKKAGLALNPETSFQLAEKYLPYCDLILFMSVNPGFGGQKFIPETLEKIRLARKEVDAQKLDTEIQVDGGINEETAKECITAGANFLVSGSYLFNSKDMKKTIENLRKTNR